MSWGRNLELGFWDSSLICTPGVPLEGVPGPTSPLPQAGSTAGSSRGRSWGIPPGKTLQLSLDLHPPFPAPMASGAPNPRDVPGAGMGNHRDQCECCSSYSSLQDPRDPGQGLENPVSFPEAPRGGRDPAPGSSWWNLVLEQIREFSVGKNL